MYCVTLQNRLFTYTSPMPAHKHVYIPEMNTIFGSRDSYRKCHWALDIIVSVVYIVIPTNYIPGQVFVHPQNT